MGPERGRSTIDGGYELDAGRYIHTYIPYHLQQRNNELMKFIRAKRVNSTGSTVVRIYEYTAAAVPIRTQGNGTPPGEL